MNDAQLAAFIKYLFTEDQKKVALSPDQIKKRLAALFEKTKSTSKQTK